MALKMIRNKLAQARAGATKLPTELLVSAQTYISAHYMPAVRFESFGSAQGTMRMNAPRRDAAGSMPPKAQPPYIPPKQAPTEANLPPDEAAYGALCEQEMSAAPTIKRTPLDELVNNLGESFQARLLRMIDERGLTDPEVYKRAHIDRKHFSKIRCSADYAPRKRTALALAFALRLSLDDALDLLKSAGMTLSNSNKTDVIVSFCLDNGIYDLLEVNALLYRFGEPILA